MTQVASIPTQLCHLDTWRAESVFGLEVIHLSSSQHPLARTSPEARPDRRRLGMCPSVPGDAGSGGGGRVLDIFPAPEGGTSVFARPYR